VSRYTAAEQAAARQRDARLALSANRELADTSYRKLNLRELQVTYVINAFNTMWRALTTDNTTVRAHVTVLSRTLRPHSLPSIVALRAACDMQDSAIAVANSTLQSEYTEIQQIIHHITNFTGTRTNLLYGRMSTQVAWHYESYVASCAPVYCDVTQVG